MIDCLDVHLGVQPFGGLVRQTDGQKFPLCSIRHRPLRARCQNRDEIKNPSSTVYIDNSIASPSNPHFRRLSGRASSKVARSWFATDSSSFRCRRKFCASPKSGAENYTPSICCGRCKSSPRPKSPSSCTSSNSRQGCQLWSRLSIQLVRL